LYGVPGKFGGAMSALRVRGKGAVHPEDAFGDGTMFVGSSEMGRMEQMIIVLLLEQMFYLIPLFICDNA
jgi:hypothetical protein